MQPFSVKLNKNGDIDKNNTTYRLRPANFYIIHFAISPLSAA